MKIKFLLPACCGIAALVGTAYALAAGDGRHSRRALPVQAAIGPWRTLQATGLGSHALEIARSAGASRTAEIAGVRAADGSYVGIVRDLGSGVRLSGLTADAGDAGAGAHQLRSLSSFPLFDQSLGLITLEQSAAPDGSVGRISGAGFVRAQATRAQLRLLDGSVQPLPLVDLEAGARGFAFVATDPKRFPNAIQGLDAAGKVVAEFAFDPAAHP